VPSILPPILSACAARLRRDERGTELIEFAFVGLMLFALTFGVAEFGRAVWTYSTVAHLAREGARFAIVRGAESASTASASDVDAYVQSRAAGMTDLVVTTAWDPDNQPGSVVEVRVDRPFDPIVPLVGLGTVTLSSTSRLVIAF
jgi:Flp pilus assembly protein TadG